MITLDQVVLKIVIRFQSNRNINQVRNYLTNTVWPKLEAKIDTKMDNNFDPGWTKSIKLKLTESQEGNEDWFEAYPKLSISGTTNLTASQLRTGVSDLLADLKVTLKADFELQGATNITFHVHYQDGRSAEIDEI